MEKKEGDGCYLVSPFGKGDEYINSLDRELFYLFEDKASLLRKRFGRLWRHASFKKEFAAKWVCEWNEEEKIKIVEVMKEALRRDVLATIKEEKAMRRSVHDNQPEPLVEEEAIKDWADAIWTAVPELESAKHVAKVMGEWKNVDEIVLVIIEGLESTELSKNNNSNNNSNLGKERGGRDNERLWDILSAYFIFTLRKKGLSNITELPDKPTLFESIWRSFRGFCVTTIIWNLLHHVVPDGKEVEEKVIAQEKEEEEKDKQRKENDNRNRTLLNHLQSFVHSEEQKNLLSTEWLADAHTDKDKLALIIRLADVEDHPLAQFYLAGYYARGRGGVPDAKKAVEYLTKAANQNHVGAQEEFAVLCLEGGTDSGKSKELAKGKYWFEKAAASGSLKAQYQLGFLYSRGIGVECDYFQAHTWFEKAAMNWDWDASDEKTVAAARNELHMIRKMILRMINTRYTDASPATTQKKQISSKEQQEKEREESFLPEHLLKQKKQGGAGRGKKKGNNNKRGNKGKRGGRGK